MTRKEAKQIISDIDKAYRNFTADEYKALEMAIKTLSQEPNRDMEEIAEIMKSDADANTKYKMISNILTAKPHYFEVEQDLCKNCLFGEGTIYCREHCPYEAKTEQTPCDDAISREDAIKALQKVTCYSAAIRARMIGAIEDLPPVTQKSGKWIKHEIEDTYRWLTCSNCGYEWINRKENYCPNCGAKMESEE